MNSDNYLEPSYAPRIDRAQLLCGGHSFPIRSLNAYSFAVDNAAVLNYPNRNLHGVLQVGDESLPVVFRFRSLQDEVCECTMPDLTLDQQTTAMRMAAKITAGVAEENRDTLQAMSYDEIASGKTSASKGTKAKATGTKRTAIVAAMCGVGLLMVGSIIGVIVIRRGTVDLNNGALIGNYLPMSAEEDGYVTHIFVNQNERIEKGQPLFRVSSSQQETEREDLRMECANAKAGWDAQEEQLKSYGKLLDVTVKVLEKDIEVAQASMRQTEVALRNAVEMENKLIPLLRSKSISGIDLQTAKALKETLAEEQKVKQAEIERLELALNAAKVNIIVGEGGKLDDRLSQLQLACDLAKSNYEESERKLKHHDAVNAERTVVAAETGNIYSVYSSVGQFVKAGQTVVSIGTADETNWAIGHLTGEEALRVRPGQKVNIFVPSIGLETEGEVAAVGHRGLYSESGWSNDFRGELPTDVPVKVILPDRTLDLPSGLRLKMSVDIDHVWPWQKNELAARYRKAPEQEVPETAVGVAHLN
jgi:multidrug resistance efflux pump